MKLSKKTKIRLEDAQSKRTKDGNGYLIISDNPIAKAGVFDYLRYEIDSSVEAGTSEGDAIVRVCREFSDLEAKKYLFANMPIKFSHKWVGREGEDTAEGAIGGEITASEPYLRADIIIYSQELIEAIERGDIVELSPAYEAEIVKEDGEYDGEPYQFKQILKSVNHLAVVEVGRSGHDLKLQDKKQISNKEQPMKIKDFLASFKKLADDAQELAKKETEDNDKVEDTETEDDEAKEVKDNEQNQKVDDDDDDDAGNEQRLKDNDKVEDDDDDDDDKESASKLADSIEKLVDAKVNQKLAELKKLNDAKDGAYSEVSSIVGAFNANGMSVNSIYAHGYNCVTGKKVADGLDAKTAFVMATQDTSARFSVKAQDSAQKVDDGLAKIASRYLK